MNYFEALERIRPDIEANNKQNELKFLFQTYLNCQFLEPVQHQAAARLLDVSFVSQFPKRTCDTSNCTEVFEKMITLAEGQGSVEFYIAFLRYLGLYLCGKITHETFARVAAGPSPTNLHSEIVASMPLFLATVNTGACFRCGVRLPQEMDTIAREVVLKLTSSLMDSETTRSVSRCLECLALELVSKDLGRKWMMDLVRSKEIDEMLSKMTDFTLFLPGRFPQELVLSPDFMTDRSTLTTVQRFAKRYLDRANEKLLKPATKELISVKMRAVRILINDCLAGSVDRKALFAFYGDKSAVVAEQLMAYPEVVVRRLRMHYLELHDILMHILHRQMAGLKPDDIEYRIAFKSMWHPSVLNHFYMHESVQSVKFGTKSVLLCAAALVGDFVKSYFDDESVKMKLLMCLRMILSVFDSDDFFVLEDAEVKSLIYIHGIASLIESTGNAESVAIDESGLIPSFDTTQKSDFGKKMQALPASLKTIPYYALELSGTPLQNVDILLTRCVRQFNMFEAGKDALFVYPDTIEDYLTFTCCHRSGTEPVELAFNNVFSPVYDLDEDESDEVYQGNKSR